MLLKEAPFVTVLVYLSWFILVYSGAAMIPWPPK